MLQRPGEAHAIWHFWKGRSRSFAGWYINLQEPFRRTKIGYDTQDLELDLVVQPAGSWRFKDAELLPQRIAEGRFTARKVDEVRAEGERIATALRRGDRWWEDSWTRWVPPGDWSTPPLPAGWEKVPGAGEW